MKFDCFYEVKIIRGKRTRTEKWGYFPYSIVKKDVKALYKDGADKVMRFGCMVILQNILVGYVSA